MEATPLLLLRATVLLLVCACKSVWCLSCYQCQHLDMTTGSSEIDQLFAALTSPDDVCKGHGDSYTEAAVSGECQEIPDLTPFCWMADIGGSINFAGFDVDVDFVARGCNYSLPGEPYPQECSSDVTAVVAGFQDLLAGVDTSDMSGTVCACDTADCNGGRHVIPSLFLVTASLISVWV